MLIIIIIIINVCISNSEAGWQRFHISDCGACWTWSYRWKKLHENPAVPGYLRLARSINPLMCFLTGGLLYVVFQELFSSSSPSKIYGKAFKKCKAHAEVDLCSMDKSMWTPNCHAHRVLFKWPHSRFSLLLWLYLLFWKSFPNGLLPIHWHESICDHGLWYQVRRPGVRSVFQVIPVAFSGFVQVTQDLSIQPWTFMMHSGFQWKKIWLLQYTKKSYGIYSLRKIHIRVSTYF